MPTGRSLSSPGLGPLETNSESDPRPSTAAERTFERSLALEQGVLICPRAGSVVLATCDGCPFFCRTETESSSVICSYPIPGRETFATRSRHSETLRIALRHQLERT